MRGTPAREGSGDARPVEKSVLDLRARWMVRDGCMECMCCSAFTTTLEVRGVGAPCSPRRLVLMVCSCLVGCWIRRETHMQISKSKHRDG